MTYSEKLDFLLIEIVGMKTEFQGMKTEFQGMKTDIQNMKTDIKKKPNHEIRNPDSRRSGTGPFDTGPAHS